MFDKSKFAEIGQRIKKARLSKKITQESLGKITGLSESVLSKIENNVQTPTLEQIADIAIALNSRIEYILGLDKVADKETEFIRDFIKSFSRITTTKEYSANNEGIYTGKDFIFGINEDYLVLTGSESLFALIKEIAKAENIQSKVSKKDYELMLRSAKHNFIQNKDNSREDSYFLISGEQMTEIIESAVIDRCYVESLFEEMGITLPLEGQALSNLKEIKKNRSLEKNK